jgi:hypothetical protein
VSNRKQPFALIAVIAMIASTSLHAQVTGGGTTGKIPKWSGSTALADSIMTETSGQIGVNGTAGTGLAVGQEAIVQAFGSLAKQSFLMVQNTTTDTNSVSVVRTQSDSATQNFQSHSSARTISRFGVTLGGWNEFLAVNGNGLILGTNTGTPLIFGTSALDRLHITPAGNVGIGDTNPTFKLEVSGTAHVTGDVTVDGNLAALYQDVAEWVPSDGRLTPGTVVVISSDKTNEVTPSGRAYDTRVAGVVSQQPGLTLGKRSDEKSQIATVGRVKVHVDATKAPIAVGDLLVTSDVPGTAMKSQPVNLSGIEMHRPGTLLGKALEPLASGQGEILVLLSLQ